MIRGSTRPLGERQQQVTGRRLRRSLRAAAATFLGMLMLLLAVNTGIDKYASSSINAPKQEKTLSAQDFYGTNKDAANNAKEVKVGMYIDSLLDLNLRNSTFKATGWMWYSWMSECENNSCNQEEDPYGKFDLNYVSDDANKQASSFGAPVDWQETGKKTGSMWNEINFGGSFYTPLNLRKFPFDTQKLEIRITSPEHEADQVKYIFEEFVAPKSQILIPGYDILGTRSRETVREYASKFGFDGDLNNTQQSQLIAELVITRNIAASLFRYFLPIAVVLAVTLITTRLKPEYWEIKLASPATAILSLLFLQDGFRNEIPPTSYLSVLDFYFVISYIILILCLTDACMEAGLGSKEQENKGATTFDKTNKRRVATKLPEILATIIFATSPAITYAYFIAI